MTSAVEVYLEERKLHNQGLVNQEASRDALNQDPHNQATIPYQDGNEAEDMEAEQMNSGKATPLQLSYTAPEVGGEVRVALAGGGASEGGGEDDAKRGNTMTVDQSSSVKLSVVGALGEKAYNALTCGVVLDDHLVISILMEELRSVEGLEGKHTFHTIALSLSGPCPTAVAGCWRASPPLWSKPRWVRQTIATPLDRSLYLLLWQLLASALTGQDNPQPRKTHHFVFVTEPQNTVTVCVCVCVCVCVFICVYAHVRCKLYLCVCVCRCLLHVH